MASDEVLVHVAGSRAGERGDVDGTGTAVRFHQPLDIQFNNDESWLYVADYGNFKVKRVNVDTGETETFAELDASPNCIYIDDNDLIWVNTIGPHNDTYEYEVEDVGDAEAEYALGVKVPNQGGVSPEAMWCFEPDGNLIFRVNVISLVDPGPFAEPGASGSFIAQSGGYSPGVSVGGGDGKHRNTQSGHPYGGDDANNFSMRLGTFQVASDPDAGDGGNFDLTKGYWYEFAPGDIRAYPQFTVEEDGYPPLEECPSGDNCGSNICGGDPDQKCCCQNARASDGAFASNAGLIDLGGAWTSGRPQVYLFGLSYQYPSNTGVAAVDYQPLMQFWPGKGADCINDADLCNPENLPNGLVGIHGDMNSLTSCVRWSDAFGSTDVYEFPRGYAQWGSTYATAAGWQIAKGRDPVFPESFLSEVGNSMYNRGTGFLQTYQYTDATNISENIHRGMAGAPVRGVAYSATREEWYFSTSSNGGGYGPYSKNVDGTGDSDIGYHQIMRMVPFTEVNPTATYHLGEFSASIESESDDTTTGIFVGMHIEVRSLGVAPAAAVIDVVEGTALATGAVVPGPAYNEPPQLPDQFIRDPNPLPPETEPREVPLPPWIPDGGPYRES